MKIRLDAGSGHETYQISGDKSETLISANRFLRAIHLRGLSGHTVRAYGYDLVLILRWLHETKRCMKDLTCTDLIEWIATFREINADPNSINRRLVTCRIFYRFCFDCEIPRAKGTNLPSPYYTGQTHDHRLGLIRFRRQGTVKLRVKAPEKLVEPLDARQVEQFFENITRYRDMAIVMLMLFCGLRSCEVLSLTVGNLNTKDGELRILGKGNKERMLPLSDLIGPILQRYYRFERPDTCSTDCIFVVLQGARRGESMTATGLTSLFRNRRRSSGVHSANPHRFRHVFATEMVRHGVQLHVLQKMLGHSSLRMVQRYAHTNIADVTQAYHTAMSKIQSRYANLKG